MVVPRTDEEDALDADHLASQALVARLPQLRIEDPYGVVNPCSIRDIHEVSQWFFASQVDSQSAGKWVTLSSQAWGEHFWDIATKSEISFTYLMLLVVHKRMVLSGRKHAKDFYLMQRRIITLLQESVNDSFESADPETALTICGLALFSLREGDHVTTRAHMTAVQALSRLHYVQDSPCWIMCSWIDLFIATAFAWRPFLPYQLPSPGEHASAAPHRIEEARRDALKASRNIPRLGPDFGSHEAFELLSKLNEACFAAEDRNMITQPPFNLLYNIVFQLCQLSLTAEPHLRLLVIALQLCWLSAGRFWLPQARPLWPTLLVRLDATLQSCPEIIAKWQQEECLGSLLWVALIGHQNARRSFPGLGLRFVAIARCTRELLGITRLHDFRRFVAPFPGIPSEKEAAIKGLWEVIRPSPAAPWVAIRDEDMVEQQAVPLQSESRKFITIFQFETLQDTGTLSRHWSNNWGQNVGP